VDIFVVAVGMIVDAVVGDIATWVVASSIAVMNAAEDLLIPHSTSPAWHFVAHPFAIVLDATLDIHRRIRMSQVGTGSR
jgi:hypothetical protein